MSHEKNRSAEKIIEICIIGNSTTNIFQFSLDYVVANFNVPFQYFYQYFTHLMFRFTHPMPSFTLELSTSKFECYWI